MTLSKSTEEQQCQREAEAKEAKVGQKKGRLKASEAEGHIERGLVTLHSGNKNQNLSNQAVLFYSTYKS